MRIIIIGAVAAGTSAAAKASRNRKDADIIVYEKDSFISYAGCSIPYYISGEIQNAADIIPRDAAFFQKAYGAEIKIRHEVLSIAPKEKTLTIKNLDTEEVFTDTYDKLILATGARSAVPPIKGREGAQVFTLRNIEDMHRIKAFLQTHKPRRAAIIGTGFIGLEICESLINLGLEVSLLEKLPQVIPSLDADMAAHVEEYIKSLNIPLYTDVNIVEITSKSVLLEDGREIPAELVLMATGVRPNTELAAEAGIKLGQARGILVNAKMETNLPDIYACGDCAEFKHIVTKQPVYRPMGSTANKTGRIAGDAATGGSLTFKGVAGTSVFRFFQLTVAQTGLSERDGTELGYDMAIARDAKPHKPIYMGGREMKLKAIAHRGDHRLLGVQIVGFEGVDKRIDVFATALSLQARAEDLKHLDLAYAPPYALPRDVIFYTGLLLEKALQKRN